MEYFTDSDIKKVRFFEEDKVVFLVDHEQRLVEAELRGSLNTILGQLDAPKLLRNLLESDQPLQTQSFEKGEWQPQPRVLMQRGWLLSLVYAILGFLRLARPEDAPSVDDEGPNLSDVPPFFTFATMNLQESDYGLERAEGMADDDYRLALNDALVDVLFEVNEKLANNDAARENGVQLQGVIPNWLNAGAQGQLPVGGPGSLPVPATADSSMMSHPLTSTSILERWWQKLSGGTSPDKTRFDLKHRRLNRGGGSGVTVAILDTLPSGAQLQNAFGTWVVTPSQENRHPLLLALLSPASAQAANPTMQPGGKLETVYSAQAALPRLMGCHSSGSREHAGDTAILGHHFYPMVDHGLFISGIINSIAPDAQLRLVQVLNCYGVGSLGLLADGLLRLLNNWPDGKVVVNCSLTFALPDNRYRKHGPLMDQMPLWKKLADNPVLIEPTEAAIHRLFAAVRARGAAIVAAAGNEGVDDSNLTEDEKHPAARMPASDPLVIGVGAVDENLNLTSYTNHGDTPLSDGFLTYGGVADGDFAAGASAGSNAGILGVYTQTFPVLQGQTISQRANQNGWGYWAGTSFATPILSAAMAILLGQGESVRSAEMFLRSLHVENKTGEDVFPVTQGP